MHSVQDFCSIEFMGFVERLGRNNLLQYFHNCRCTKRKHKLKILQGQQKHGHPAFLTVTVDIRH